MSAAAVIGIAGVLGTLGAGLGGAALGARKAEGLEKRHEQREKLRDRRKARAAARLIDGDLAAIEGSAANALDRSAWRAFLPIPTQAWDQHGVELAAALSEDDFQAVARAFAQASAFGRMIRETYGGPDVPLEPENREQLVAVHVLVRDARARLEPVAWQSGPDEAHIH